MFTGLVEEIGKVSSIISFGGGKRIKVSATKVMSDLKIDDSISINGTCQTVVAINGQTFEVEAVEETLKKTTLGEFKIGTNINLERALVLGSRLGGHIVQGHIDCTGKITNIKDLQSSRIIWVQYPVQSLKYVIKHGSVCVDGISLTIADISNKEFMLSVIPHTVKNTIIANYKIGNTVNLEFDIIGKYIENLFKLDDDKPVKTKSMSILEQYIEQPKF
jgi:riboflavin synthase